MTKVTSPSYRDGLPPSWNVQNSGMANEGTVGNAPLASIPGTDLSGVLQSASNLSDVPDKKTARTNLGAGFNVFHAVVDYGAAAGGSAAANTTALQACLTDAAAAKGTAYIPAGVYSVNAALTAASYTRVQGDSFYGTIIVQTANNTDTLQIMGADSSHIITGVELRDIQLQGNGIGSGSTGVALNLNWCDDTNVFERIFATAAGSHGCLMQNSYVTAFRDCWFAYNGGDGFHGVTSVNAVSWQNCEFGWNSGDGLFLNGMAGCVVFGCDIESNGKHGMELQNCYSFTVQGNDFENNGTLASNTYNSILVNLGTSYSGVSILGNNFTGTGGMSANGVELSNVTSAFLQGNSFNNFGTQDILIDSSSSGVTIGTNNVHEGGAELLINDQGSGTTYLGISDGPDTPADYGYKEWNYNPYQAGTPSSSLAGFSAGVVFGARLTVRRVRTVTRVWIMWYPGTGTAASNSYYGLYNSSGTRVAVSTDVSGTATGQISVSFSSTVLQPGNYWVAMLVGTQAGTTNAGAYINPNCVSAGIIPSTGAGISAATAKWVKLGNLTGQSSLPGSVTLASNVVSAVPFWCAVS